MKHKAKFLFANFIVMTLLVSAFTTSQSFATAVTPITTIAPTTPIAPTKTFFDPTLKGALNQEVPSLLDAKAQQLSTTFLPYEFTPQESDFATNKWQKYIKAVYVYATDVSFIITIGYVDGRIEQKTSLDSAEVAKILADAKSSNEEIQAAALALPDDSFKAFYETVYSQPYVKLFTGEFIPFKTLSNYKLQEKAPALVNAIIADYTLYKRGSFYVLTWSEYPSFNQHSLVSSSLSVIQKQLVDIDANNTNLLVNAKIIAKPATTVTKPAPVPAQPSFTVISLYSDKTYTITTFKTKAEADKYAAAQVKIVGKNNVKTVSAQAEIDKIIKGLKVRAPKK